MIKNIKNLAWQSWYVLCVLIFTSIQGQTHYYSSTINRQHDCNNPLILTDSTVVHMDEDMYFATCFPFVAGPTFLPTDTVTFVSTDSKKCIFAAYATIDFRPVCPLGQSIILKGNIQWVVKQGVTLILNNNLEVHDNAHLVFEDDDL